MASVKKSVASAVCAALIMTGAGGGGLEALAATLAASRSAGVPAGLEAGAAGIGVLRFERGLLKGLGPSAPGLTGSLPSSAIPSAVQPALVPAASAPESRPDAPPPVIGSLAGLADQAPSGAAAPGAAAGLESEAGRFDEVFDGKSKNQTPLVVGAGLTPEAVKDALRTRRLVVDIGPLERSGAGSLKVVEFSYDPRYPDHIVGTLQKVGERGRVVSVGYPPADVLLKPTGRADAPLMLVLSYYFEHYRHHTWREVVVSVPLSESVLVGGAVGTDAAVTVRYYDGKSPEKKVEGKARYRFEPAQEVNPAPFPPVLEFSAKVREGHRALLSAVFAANAGAVERVVKRKVGEGLNGIALFIPYATEQRGGHVLFVVTVVRNGYPVANFRVDVDKNTKTVRFSNNNG